jgi:NADH pyrophosphatase NudC (nudix superfamily)
MKLQINNHLFCEEEKDEIRKELKELRDGSWHSKIESIRYLASKGVVVTFDVDKDLITSFISEL